MSTMFEGIGTQLVDLGGLPIASIAEYQTALFDLPGLLQRLREHPRGGIIVAPFTNASDADLQLVDSSPKEEASAKRFRIELLSLRRFHSPAQSVILIDEPCFVVPKSGAVFLNDGRPLRETLYPSSGDQDFQRIVGAGCDRRGFATLMSDAPNIETIKAPALLFSRWSSVYAHALSEVLTHECALRARGFFQQIDYIYPAALDGCQNMIASHLSGHRPNSTPIVPPVVRVPRVLTTTLLYQYATFADDFSRLVKELRTASPSGGHERIYASRVDAHERPMRNEGGLASELRARGFKIVVGAQHSLAEQIAAYSGARIVVGPHGSNLINASFAMPCSTLFELRPLNRRGQNPMWDVCFLRQCAGARMSYMTHISVNPPETDAWNADIPAILSQLDSFLSTHL